MRVAMPAICLGSALFVLRPASARADADGSSFVWQAPEGCPTSREVEARIAARLHGGSAWSVRGDVIREGNQFRVRLTTPSGERVLTAPTCDKAAEAVAVIVALAVDGTKRDEPPTEAAAPEVRRSPEEPAQPTALVLAFGAAFDTSSLPHPSAGLGLGVGVARGPFSASLDVTGFLRQTERSPGVPPVTASVGLVELMASVCALSRSSTGIRVEGGGCVAAGLGLLPAESAGITSPNGGTGVRPEAMVAGRAGLWLGDHLVLRAQVGPMAGLARPPFEVTGIGEVYRPPTWTFRAALGLETHFW